MSHNIILQAKVRSINSLLKKIQEFIKENLEVHHDANTHTVHNPIVIQLRFKTS